MTPILALTSAGKPDELLGTITLIGDNVVTTPATEGLFRSFSRRAGSDAAAFKLLSEGWSNGYAVLTPVLPAPSTRKE